MKEYELSYTFFGQSRTAFLIAQNSEDAMHQLAVGSGFTAKNIKFQKVRYRSPESYNA